MSRINIVALPIATALFVFSVSIAPVQDLIPTATTMLAGAVVSVSAGVASNPDNTLQAQLLQKKNELDTREAQLSERERNTTDKPVSSNNSLALYSFLLSLALFILVAINFYMDWARGKKGERTVRQDLAIDLRRHG